MHRVPGWKDRAARWAVALGAHVVFQDGRKVRVTLTNLSDEGCQIIFPDDQILPIGAKVQLDLDLARFDAEVRWALGGKAGLVFRQAL